jgi:hypothetical protein
LPKGGNSLYGAAQNTSTLMALLMKWFLLFFSFWIAGQPYAFAAPASPTAHTSCFVLDGKRNCTLTVDFVGEIVSTSVEAVAALLDQYGQWRGGKQIIVNSLGGSLDGSMALGRLLRRNRMTILIPKGAECVSACVMVFAGAVSRLYLGKIGIHRPYLNQSIGSHLQAADKIRGNYEQMLQSLRSYLREMNVSERLAEDMLKIPPADVRYLSHDDLDGYGLTDRDPVEQEAIDLEDAQSMGLDRKEYIRRQALQKTRCGTLGHMLVDDFIACRERVLRQGY